LSIDVSVQSPRRTGVIVVLRFGGGCEVRISLLIEGKATISHYSILLKEPGVGTKFIPVEEGHSFFKKG
jgi:hypothetical protein